MEIKAYEYNNIKEFIDNPMGKGSTAIMQKHLILNDIKLRMELLQKTKHFEYTVYKEKKDYFIHIKVPSESERDNTYDVVIKFIPMDKTMETSTVLSSYGIQFFSNCPSFTYTFAYAFNKEKMLIDILSKKYDSIVLKQEPSQRNPHEIISYEKSITMACLYILNDHRLLSKIHLDRMAINGTKKLISEVRNTDEIKLEVDTLNKKIRAEKKEEERKRKQQDGLITERKRSDGKMNKVDKQQKKSGSKVGKIAPKSKITPRKPGIRSRKGL